MESNTTPMFLLPLSEPLYQFADEKAFTAFLNDRESDQHSEIVRGIGYYLDDTKQTPLGNLYYYDDADLGAPPPAQPLSVVRVMETWDNFVEDHADDYAFIDHAELILGGNKGEVALLRKLAQPFETPAPSQPAPETIPLIDQIVQIAGKSAIADHTWWKGQGPAPVGYIKGMALVYARAYLKLKAGNPAAVEMAKANTQKSNDVLAFYNQQLSNAGLGNNNGGDSTLRHLFALLIGLAMPESSGRYWLGADPGAHNHDGETAEAGLFQTSWNARAGSQQLMRGLFDQYLANPSGYVEYFKEGVGDQTSPNWGSGDGLQFQRLSKDCPAFAAEFTAVGLRNIRTHWGTISDGKVEIRTECDAMLQDVQKAVDDSKLTSV